MNVHHIILIILGAAALLLAFLWYALIIGWALVLRRMAGSVSTWEELEQDPHSLG